VLTFSGERPSPGMGNKSKPVRVHLMEIDHGSFCRSVEVPSDVDSEKIEASYRGGYLFVHLPKKGNK
jgi:HSP20 family protein